MVHRFYVDNWQFTLVIASKSPRLEFYSEGISGRCVFNRPYQENWLEQCDNEQRSIELIKYP